MLIFDVFLLMDVNFQVVEHLPVKKVETVMIASHIKPVAKAGGTLAYLGPKKKDFGKSRPIADHD